MTSDNMTDRGEHGVGSALSDVGREPAHNAALEAPWDEATVAALNWHQGRHDRHPFTCPADGTRGSKRHSDRRILVALPDGWACEFHDCGYRQRWAHHAMAEVVPFTTDNAWEAT